MSDQLLTTTVGWTLMFRVKNRDKAEKRLALAHELLGQQLSVNSCERYWKIPELWTCGATTSFEAPSTAEQITECLLLANRLAGGWYVLGPHLRPDGTLESFNGIFDRRHSGAKIQSLEWAQFQVGAEFPVLESPASPSP